MKGELGLLVICTAMFLAGVATSSDRTRSDRAAFATIAADNAELRETSRTLRRRCPARPRLQRTPFTPGKPI